jgi:hypothetical protein
MRDALALALVRAELCRVHAIAQRRRVSASGKLGAGTMFAATRRTKSRIPFIRDRGARHNPMSESDSSSPPD